MTDSHLTYLNSLFGSHYLPPAVIILCDHCNSAPAHPANEHRHCTDCAVDGYREVYHDMLLHGSEQDITESLIDLQHWERIQRNENGNGRGRE